MAKIKFVMILLLLHAQVMVKGIFGHNLSGNTITLVPSTNSETSIVLSVYPNPVTNASVIAVDLSTNDEIEICLSDLSGKLISKVTSGSFSQGTCDQHRSLFAPARNLSCEFKRSFACGTCFLH